MMEKFRIGPGACPCPSPSPEPALGPGGSIRSQPAWYPTHGSLRPLWYSP
jgi:hypothetical protein